MFNIKTRDAWKHFDTMIRIGSKLVTYNKYIMLSLKYRDSSR